MKIHIVYGNMKDLRDEVIRLDFPQKPILLLSYKTDLPLGAYAPDGRSGGSIYSRRSVLTRRAPNHDYNNSCAAYRELYRSAKEKK